MSYDFRSRRGSDTVAIYKITAGILARIGRVEDEVGGWIADRFGPALGLREAKRCAEQLEREGVRPEG